MTAIRDRLPVIPEAELAARYVRNEMYERALLIAKHHRGIHVHPTIAALLPGYAERRQAAAAVLAKDPKATRHMKRESRERLAPDEYLAPVNAPPSQAETDALRERVEADVKRYEALEPVKVDTDAQRETLWQAVRSGDFGATVAAWDGWLRNIATSANIDRERADLAVALCIRTVGPGPGAGSAPGPD